MEIEEYTNIRYIDTYHFYYKAIVSMIVQQIRKYKNDTKGLTILDAGCGTGYLTQELSHFGKAEGVDIHPAAVSISTKRGITVRKASVTALPFNNQSFDVVVSVDVLYHKRIDNDEQALDEFFRVLKPNGILLLRVPAHSYLYVKHDAYVHTSRRYSAGEIIHKTKKAGFTIEYSSYTQASLYPLRLMQKVMERLITFSPHSGIYRIPHSINELIYHILRMEIYLQNFFSLPFGIGVCVVGRKPSVKITDPPKTSSRELV